MAPINVEDGELKAGLDINLLGCLISFQGGHMVDETLAHPAPDEDVIIL